MKNHIILLLLSLVTPLTIQTNSLANERSYSARAAEVTLFSVYMTSSFSSGSFFGHSFIQIKNLYMNNVSIGGISTDYNETITLGTWQNQSGHQGIWYNLESYFYHKTIQNSDYNGRVSISEYISSEELDDLNSLIDSKDYWNILYNCSSFASDCWNLFSDRKVDPGLIPTPENLSNSIKQYDYVLNGSIGLTDFAGYMGDTGFVKVY